MKRYWHWYDQLHEPQRFFMAMAMGMPFFLGAALLELIGPLALLVMVPTFLLMFSRQRGFAKEAPMDLHSDILAVTVLDRRTGATATDSTHSPWWWWMGNGSCDCNRQQLFGHDRDTGYCLGNHRYVVVRAEPLPEGFVLDDFNRDYDHVSN